MKLAKLLNADQIILDMKAVEHWPAIIELVDHLTETGRLPQSLRDETLEALKAREDQVSTGIGSGVAIPHTFSDHLQEVIAVFGRSKQDGEDFVVNTTVENNTIVVHGTYPYLVIRHGKNVVGLRRSK